MERAIAHTLGSFMDLPPSKFPLAEEILKLAVLHLVVP